MNKFTHVAKKHFYVQSVQRHLPKKCRLTQHEQLHSGEKPFECETCSKTFPLKQYLTIHEQIHFEKKKLYVCVQNVQRHS